MGWLLDLLTAPGLTMHARLHRIRAASPPAEHPEIIPVTESRPYDPAAPKMTPPKPVPLKQQVRAPAERRDSSPIKPRE